jgi:hypothetical protein
MDAILAREMELMFWSSVNAISIFVGFFTFYRLRKISGSIEKDQKSTIVSWLYLVFLFSFANFLSLFNRLYWGFMYSVDLFTIVLVLLGSTIKIYEVETHFHPLKFRIFTIISIMVIIGYIVTGNVRESNLVSIFLAIFMVIGFSIFPIMYLYVAISSTGPVRQLALKIFVAIVAVALALMGQRHNILAFFPDMVLFFENSFQLPWVLIPSTLWLLGVVMIYSTYQEILY